MASSAEVEVMTDDAARTDHRVSDIFAAGNERLAAGDYEGALDFYRKGLDHLSQTELESDGAELRRQMVEYLSHYPKTLEEIQKVEKLLAFQGDSIELGNVCTQAAKICLRLGHYEQALSYAERAFEILKNTGENEAVARVQRYMGVAYLSMGELERAMGFFQDNLSTLRRIGDQRGMAYSSNRLARVCVMTSRWNQAIEHLERALEYSQKVEDKTATASFMGNLGTVYIFTCDWEKAKRCQQTALAMSEAQGAKLDVCHRHICLAILAFIEREWDVARKHIDAATEIVEEEEYERERCLCHQFRGRLAYELGDFEGSLDGYQKALVLAERIAPWGDLINEIYRHLAELKLDMGDDQSAEEACLKSIEVSEHLGDKREKAIATRVLGLVYERKKKREKALDLYEESMVDLRQIGEKFERAKTLREAGRLLAETYSILEEKIRAYQYLGKAREMFETLNVPFWLARTELDLASLKIKDAEFDGALETLDAAENHLEGLLEKEKELVEEGQRVRAEIESHLIHSSTLAYREYDFFDSLGRSPRPVSKPGLKELLSMVVDRIDAERGLIARANSDGMQLWSWVNTTKDVAAGLLERLRPFKGVYRPGELLLSTKVKSDDRFTELRSLGVSSVLIMPFGLAEEIEGIIYLDRQGAPFGLKELNFFTLFCHGIALKIAQIKQEELRRQNIELRQQLHQERSRFSCIITQNTQMLRIIDTIEKIKDCSIPILIEGETGTGKELVARTIHYNSERCDKRFVPVNCAAFPDTLLESELFGHRKGAFTGADRDKPGLVEIADGGTFFLDEAAEMGPSSQLKLLRVLEVGEVTRLGETEPRQVDIRVVSATNKDLRKEVEEGRFREDLFYRLNGLQLTLPPLRERKEDIPLLIDFFGQRSFMENDRTFSGISPAATKRLMDYSWPGNIRELQNEVRRMAALAVDGQGITEDLLSERVRFGTSDTLSASSLFPWISPGSHNLKETIEELEKRMIIQALEECTGNKTKAAELLGITRQWLIKKIDRYGIQYSRSNGGGGNGNNR
jgi:transcriptional regulator with GAF, ATPase, and Fis domain/tetratricopeptide (TPR) repeat protein